MQVLSAGQELREDDELAQVLAEAQKAAHFGAGAMQQTIEVDNLVLGDDTVVKVRQKRVVDHPRTITDRSITEPCANHQPTHPPTNQPVHGRTNQPATRAGIYVDASDRTEAVPNIPFAVVPRTNCVVVAEIVPACPAAISLARSLARVQNKVNDVQKQRAYHFLATGEVIGPRQLKVDAMNAARERRRAALEARLETVQHMAIGDLKDELESRRARATGQRRMLENRLRDAIRSVRMDGWMDGWTDG